jgi:exopolysaccharide biosynthesis polyprenyl glycosylphosphotransferase
MTRISRKRRQFLIFLVDIAILFISIPIALFLRKFEMPEFSMIITHIYTFTGIIAFWEILLYSVSMYSLEQAFNVIQTALKMLIVSCISLLAGFAFFYLFLDSSIAPKTVLIIYSGVAFLLLMGWRVLYNFFFGARRTRPRVVFIGYNETVSALIEEMGHFSYFGFTPAAIYDPESQNIGTSPVPFFSDPASLLVYLEKYPAEIFIMASEKSFPMEIRQYLFSCLANNSFFYSLPDFFELVSRKIPIGSINDTWLLAHLEAASKSFFNGIKRTFDLIISSVILICTCLLWPIIALIIKIESPGPVFFSQIREGRNGKPFKILKFRTMRVEDNSFTPTGKHDSRITPFGNFLRKSRLDEIPQVINVFRGDMSLIGPRPERPELAKDLEKSIPYYKQRLIVKPGITGWDQVSGEYHSPSVEDTYKKLQYDLYYIKNRSILLDLSISIKTITTVLKRSGR